MHLTDEQIIDAWMTCDTLTEASAKLGTSKQHINQTVYKLAALGVAIPISKAKRAADSRSLLVRYNSKRIQELNEFIARYVTN